MNGRICMITGANSGIGKITALELAKMGANVVMICRNVEKGEVARKEIVKKTGNRSIELLLADFSSQSAVRKLVHDFKLKYSKLHVLINNIGTIMPIKTFTEDGLETTFAVNHLGCFLLTNLLLDIIKKSAPARIINVSSESHKDRVIDFSNLNGERNYNLYKAYAQSKLANILFTYELARRLGDTKVTINCLHPGMVRTKIWQKSGRSMLMKVFMRIFSLFLKSAQEGAQTSIYLASSPELESITGKYFIDKKMVLSSPVSYDEGLAKQLWEVSEKLVGLKE
jgi:NAD(P)-dependent dehydrogenase (short-subunit alcohol dehydrogenase family)